MRNLGHWLIVPIALLLWSPIGQASDTLNLSFTLPKLDVSPYHRPYVAVWIETAEREYVTTLTLWADDPEWYKDLRQWWRKVGRKGVNVDGVTSATRKPGDYSLNWQGSLPDGVKLTAGDYLLNVEVSREEGGRSYFRQAFEWPKQMPATSSQDKGELHNLTFTIQQAN